jgi:hypothetical protein
MSPAGDKRRAIERARAQGVCPACGRTLPPVPEPVGTGRLADGLFCGLDCLASFHDDYFEERRELGTPTDN